MKIAITLHYLTTAISEQKIVLDSVLKHDWCPRIEEDQVELDSSLAQVVLGVRRSGKTTLCYNVLKKSGKRFGYVNFDDERLANLRGEDLNTLLQAVIEVYGKFEVLFLDEIQNIPEWFLFANRLLRQGIRLLITGSNAKILSGELATHLTGRYVKIELYPFSFSEYCVVKGVDCTSVTTEAAAFRHTLLREYLERGGFPELLNLKNRARYVGTLLENILEEDIHRRYKIRYMADFVKMTNHVLNMAPSILSLKELQGLFAIQSNHTVDNYIRYMASAYLIRRVPCFSYRSRLRMHNEKVYAVDVALMRDRPDTLAGENLGWRLESVVLFELLRRNVPLGRNVFYYRDKSCEVDFVVCAGGRVVSLVQVCYDLGAPKTRGREVRALVNVGRKLRCDDLWLVNDSEWNDENHDGAVVKLRPASDWLAGGGLNADY